MCKDNIQEVHHRGTFSVSSNNNKCKYALNWYSLIVSIGPKYTFIC